MYMTSLRCIVMTSRTRKKPSFLKSSSHVYMCSVCEKIQTSLLEMRRHIRIHRTYECGACSRTFKDRHQLRNHFVNHHQKSEHSCPICKKVFPHIRYLEQHVKIHSSIRRFRCEVCEKQFTQLVHLKSHSATHQSVKPFPCKLCKKSFSCKGSLLRHVRVHSKKELFACDICDKRFTRKDSLVLHVQVIHELKRNHKCSECDMAFSQRAYLKVHHAKAHSENAKKEVKQAENSRDSCKPKTIGNTSKQLLYSVSILKKLSKEAEHVHLQDGHSMLEDDLKKENNCYNLVKIRNFESEEECKEKGFVSQNDSETLCEPELISNNNLCITSANSLLKSNNSCSPCAEELKSTLPKNVKVCNESLSLFSDCDVCEILDTPPNLETDFLLEDSFTDWESDCRLPDETLPVCSMEQDPVLESCQEFNNKDFLSGIPDDYFTTLQCTMPF